MSLLLLEALGALILFVFMVWWTMFSGRKNGELKGELKGEPEAESKSRSKVSLQGRPESADAAQQTPQHPVLPVHPRLPDEK